MYAPRRPAVSTPRPATAKQISFIETLCAERARDIPENLIGLDSRSASALIEELMKTPRRNAPDRREDRFSRPEPRSAVSRSSLDLRGLQSAVYLVASTSYQVDVVSGGKWSGWVFVKLLDGKRVGSQRPGQAYMGERVDMLMKIAADPMRALVAYALETGACAVCQRELTDDLSRAAGIGPTCAEKWGVDRREFAAVAEELRAEREQREAQLPSIRQDVERHEQADQGSWETVRARVEKLDVDAELAGIAAAGVLDPEENPFDLDPGFAREPRPAYQGPDSLPAIPSVMDGDW